MKVFGLTIPFTTSREKALGAVDEGRGGWFRIFESFAGAWQTNVTVDYNSVLSHPTDFACRTLIASDIAKLRLKLIELDRNGIWTETTRPDYSRILRRPNHFQTRQQFLESWLLSKLQRGNTAVLKQRDKTGRVIAMYVLDWSRVRVLVADNGDVWYELNTDALSNLPARVTVPAREIIHDRFNCLFHPLVGVSPIYAAGLSATQGLAIQQQATRFFQNGARPGGILTAPGAIADDTATRLKEYWDSNFTGEKAGKVAVLGDGLKYEAMAVDAVDAQLIEQLKWTSETVCSVYHVPTFMAQVGAQPTYNNVETLLSVYYSQCLQSYMEAIEALLADGLEMRNGLAVEIDLDGLLRTDTVARMETLDKAKGKLTVNEMRKRLNAPPIEGGDDVYLQEQDHSLSALARRDAGPDPFGANPTPALPAPAPSPEPTQERRVPQKIVRASAIRKRLEALK